MANRKKAETVISYLSKLPADIIHIREQASNHLNINQPFQAASQTNIQTHPLIFIIKMNYIAAKIRFFLAYLSKCEGEMPHFFKETRHFFKEGKAFL